MKKGYDLGGKYSQDPIGSDAPKGKDCGRRLSSRDGKPFTPSEQRLKNQLMRQFIKGDGPKGNSAAYLAAPCWCACGRLMVEELGMCRKCAEQAAA